LKADRRANSEACSEIPYAAEQGIILKKPGNLPQEQGISAAKVTIIPDEVIWYTQVLFTVPATEPCHDHRPEPHHRAGA
jgi:hypothetical protein